MTASGATDASKSSRLVIRRCLFAVVCAIVVGMLLMGAEPGLSVLKNTDAGDCYYNLLIQGFRAGQLNVKKEVPPGLARLADPYDPAANAPYVNEVGDMSYYKGRLYLYFGLTPVLVLYWPYLVITGHYLQDTWAGMIFCAVGYLAGAGLLYAIWRRYFRDVNMWAAMAGIFVFGLTIAALATEWVYCRIYEVALSGGFAFSMLTLAAVWAALHQPGRRRWLWLLLASLFYGLAVAARPSLLFGAIILFIPVVQAWRTDSRWPWQIGKLLAAAVGPIMLIGAELMVYNALRFGNPLEFGYRYQMTLLQQTNLQQFSLHYFWFNFRYYFWEPMHLSRHLPFARPVPQWQPSAGHFGPGQYYGGLLGVVSVAWLALAVPLAWKRHREGALRWFIAAACLLFITCALTMCLFVYANNRYELDFLPALMLMAVIGIFALENNRRDLPIGFARWGWGALAVCMVITSVSASLDAYVSANYFAGNVLANSGALDEAIGRFQMALTIEPGLVEAHNGLGNVLAQKGRAADAIVQYEKALEIKPDLAETHYNLGACYFELGRIADAIAQEQIAVRLDPDFVKARNELASCFLREGRIADAIAQLEETVKIAPAFAQARIKLADCLLQTGRVPEAIGQFQEVVGLNPQSVNIRCGLGDALMKAGRGAEAISEYQKAVELAPDLAGAHYDLASALLQAGRLDDAIVQYQKAVEFDPDSATFRWDFASALAKKGRPDEASAEYKKAIELEPELAKKLPNQTQPNH